MIPITYIRSSLYNSWDLCEQQVFLGYFLGWKNSTGRAACKGTIFHKVFEGLAHIKLAQQKGERFAYDEVLGKIDIENFAVDNLLYKSFLFYQNQPKKPLENKDLKEISGWVDKALKHKNGMMNPLNCDIVCPEIAFDIEIPHEWAKFNYEIQGQNVEGRLCVKGTSDLLIRVTDKIWEVRDWKTGQRKNFKTSEVKDLKYFANKDFQLRLYHYAISKTFPELEELLISIYYVNDGGVFTVNFDRSSIEYTELLLKNRFEQIKQTELPSLLSRNHAHFICKYCCDYSQERSGGQSWCQFIHEQIKKNGIGYVIEKYKKPDHNLTHYKAPGALE